VYESDWLVRFKQVPGESASASRWRVPANVWGLGITSLLTDISSEMVVSILPAYLVLAVGMAPFALGIATGLHEGGPLFATWIGGLAADRFGRRKLTAFTGYAISALCRVGWLLFPARSVGMLATLIVGDRLGKSIRTAPRDAIISLSARPDQLATAFGVHRAMDAAGAALGPILAFVLLWLYPRRYDLVFFTSFIVALLGLAALALLVEEGRTATETTDANTSAARAGEAADSAPARLRWADAWGIVIDPMLRPIVIMAAAFGLATISDAFLYVLIVRQSHAGAHWIPLLYTGTAAAFLMLAVPIGYLADRVGRRGVFVLGHIPLLLAYLVVLSGWTMWPWTAVGVVVLLGAYYASCDGVLAGLAGGVLPVHTRSSGLAWVATIASSAKLVSAFAFGLLWTRVGDRTAVAAFAVGLVAVTAIAMLSSRSTKKVIA
jgi:MFS family permease